MCFQEKFRRIQNPLPYRWRCIAPGGVEFTGLAAAEAVLRKRIGHPLTVFGIGARHGRQILHCDMSRDLAGADALLYRFGKLFHQSQSPRDPAHTAIKAPRQILESVAETLLQLGKQPALFQCRLLFGKTHRAIQNQGIGFAQTTASTVSRASCSSAATRL